MSEKLTVLNQVNDCGSAFSITKRPDLRLPRLPENECFLNPLS